MAFKKRGSWDRDEATRQSIFFVNYCPSCRTKVYMTKEEAQEFYENSYIHFYKISLINNIKKIVAFKLPRIKIIIEKSGEGEGVDNSDYKGHLTSVDKVVGYDRI